MTFADLPGRGERSAPSFEGSAEELARYFSELDSLFAQKNVTLDNEKKLGALKYLATAALERTWRASETYSDATKTYDDFKAEIHEFYPGSTDDVSTVHHLDTLIGERARLGIRNATELGEFHLQFRTISKHLISKNRLSKGEQTRGFLRALQPELENLVRQRLQITKPLHDPQDPYDLKDLYDAANYCILGSAPAGSLSALRGQPSQAQPSPPVNIKAELQGEVQSAVKSAMSEMAEMFKNMFAAQAQFAGGGSAGPPPQRAQQSFARPPGPPQGEQTKCHFCGEPGHFMRECEVVGEYIRNGKCKRNHENKLVLPSGASIPRNITGTWLRDRFNEYHRQNPNQAGGAAQMLCEVATVSAMVQEEATAESSSKGKEVRFDPQIGEPGVYAYRKRIRGKPTRSDGPTARIVEIRSDDDAEAEPTQFTKKMPSFTPNNPDSDDTDQTIEHPFARPPLTKDPLDSPEEAEQPPPRRSERAYTNSSLIYDARVAQKVFEKILDSNITITQRELLSLAPELRTKVADATVRRRITKIDDETPGAKRRRTEAHMPAAFVKAVHEPPADATIIKDPYEAFLRSRLTTSGSDEDIKVAMESNSLRAILPTVAEQEQVEAILDPGCQIVAMSEEVCIALGIAYDPNVRLNMISANGGIDQSLGLAKNVPFKIGEIIVYLQVHILRSPAYDILLGRPFDVLTESVVCNYSDENQTITILDPNTGKKATVPTVKRGSYRFAEKRKKRTAAPSSPDF